MRNDLLCGLMPISLLSESDVLQHTLCSTIGGSSQPHGAVMRNKHATMSRSCLNALQALYQEMNGPESSAFSPERSRRLAVQEAATALVCTLMPAIEPVTLVSIQPRQNSPLGQTVVRTNEQRQYAELWTRRYLEEQLITVLAGAGSLQSPPCFSHAASATPCTVSHQQSIVLRTHPSPTVPHRCHQHHSHRLDHSSTL